jgi:hypothetical protein
MSHFLETVTGELINSNFVVRLRYVDDAESELHSAWEAISENNKTLGYVRNPYQQLGLSVEAAQDEAEQEPEADPEAEPSA